MVLARILSWNYITQVALHLLKKCTTTVYATYYSCLMLRWQIDNFSDGGLVLFLTSEKIPVNQRSKVKVEKKKKKEKGRKIENHLANLKQFLEKLQNWLIFLVNFSSRKYEVNCFPPAPYFSAPVKFSPCKNDRQIGHVTPPPELEYTSNAYALMFWFTRALGAYTWHTKMRAAGAEQAIPMIGAVNRD